MILGVSSAKYAKQASVMQKFIVFGRTQRYQKLSSSMQPTETKTF